MLKHTLIALATYAAISGIAGTLAHAEQNIGLGWGDLAALRGQVMPSRETVLSSRMTGMLTAVNLKDGQKFKQGATLATFDCGLPRGEAAVARADVAKAQKVADNRGRLHKLRSISRLEADLAEVELSRAQAILSVHSTRLRYCRVLAPFAGTASDVLVKGYQFVDIGEPLFAIFDTKNLIVEMLLPSKHIMTLKSGGIVQFTIDETGERHELVLERMSGRIDPISQSVKVYARFKTTPANIRIGMSGRIQTAPFTIKQLAQRQ